VDERKNQDETDTDCGGMHCKGCAATQICAANSDCSSLVCQQKTCAEPSCEDFITNGNETGVDCGGGCPKRCADGIACKIGDDCTSGVCTNAVCQPPRCDDNVKNGSESDRDCGKGCKGCAVNLTCTSDEDCASKACAGTCTSPLHVDLLCTDRSSTTSEAHPFFKIINNGKVPFPLTSLSLRYYYTKDQAGTDLYRSYSVNPGGLTWLAPAVFGTPNPKTSTADHYLELHYTAAAGSLAPNTNSEIQGALSVQGQQLNQNNDYSFSNATMYQTSPLVTLYADGVLIWGTEPKP